MKLDIQAVERLAALAKIDLQAGEAEVYGRQLTNVLGHLDSLAEAIKFIDQHNLVDKINQQQPIVAAVDLSVDQVYDWPEAEVADSLALADSQPGQAIIMPRIK